MTTKLTWLMSVLLALSLWGSNAHANTDDPSEACKAEIMQAGAGDLSSIHPNKVVEACQNFPLSDDVFVQLLGSLVGKDFLVLMDVYQAITGREHGFDENSPLFSIGAPMHDVLKATNEFFFLVFWVLFSLVFFGQLQRWQKGHFKVGIKDWFSKNGASHATAAMLSMPIFGWMTPLQAVALLIIVLFGFVAKVVVTFLFLAAFFGNVGTQIKEEVSDEITGSFGDAVLLFQCDIKRRESLISEIQSQLQSREKSVLEANPLYQCLTSGTDGNATSVLLERGVSMMYEYTPATINQTQSCVDKYRSELNQWGYETSGVCGVIMLELPNNTASATSAANAINLYASPQVLNAQRDVALKINEYMCRTNHAFKTHDGVNVDSCMIAQTSGNGYQYQYTPNEITETLELDYYRTKMGEVSRELFITDVKTAMVQIQEGIASNLSAILQHIKDLTAPMEGESELPVSTQKKLQALREKLADSGDGGGLGFSETDADFLVNNIRKGAWLSSSLFFGSLSEDWQSEVLIDNMKKVYTVDYNLSEFIDFDNVSSAAAAFNMKRLVDTGSTEDPYLQGLSYIVPRVDLYTDNMDCWYKQVDCTTPPLNPFTYLGQRGAQILDASIMSFGALELLKKISSSVLGWTKHEANGFLLLKTIGEFQILYAIIGFVLVIIIPLIPMITLMVMMINWAYDVIRELIGLQIKITLSPFAEHGKGVLSDDVKESLVRLFGLGLYFLFVVIGLLMMFLIFSFLFAMNIFFVSALSSVVTWGKTLGSIDAMLFNVIFDCIITGLLVYEVKKVSPYMEKLPKEMADYFGIKLSPTNSMGEQVVGMIRNNVLPGVGQMLHGIKGAMSK